MKFIKYIFIISFIFIFNSCDDEATTDNSSIELDNSMSYYYDTDGGFSIDKNTNVYVINLFQVSQNTVESLQESDIKVICSFSIGQISSTDSDYNSFTSDLLGNGVWLDIGNSQTLSLIKNRINQALEKSCDGVLFQDSDNYNQNTTFSTSLSEQVTYNRSLAQEAESLNLKTGIEIKNYNSYELLSDLSNYFDLLVVENLVSRNFISYISAFMNSTKPVINIETSIQELYYQQAICQTSINNKIYTIYNDGTSDYKSCNGDF
jgi:hypothetical protein